METQPIGNFLPDEGLAIVAKFKAEFISRKYDGWHYLDTHTLLRDRLKDYEAYMASKGMVDIDYFVLVVLGEIGVRIPAEYFV